MDRIFGFSDVELLPEEKTEIGLLVSKKVLDPSVWTHANFPDSALIQVCKLACKEQYDKRKLEAGKTSYSSSSVKV